MCRSIETQHGYVAATIDLILQQGESFDFSSVVELPDPSSLTIAIFLDMYQLERCLFMKLFEKLSPLDCAAAAHKRADRLAATAVKLEGTARKRPSTDPSVVDDIEQRRLLWEASLAQRPEGMKIYDWIVLQKQLDPTYKKKVNKSKRKSMQGCLQSQNDRQEGCDCVCSHLFCKRRSSTTYSTSIP